MYQKGVKKLNVNDKCIGCGACVASYPDTFAFTDEGKSSVVNNEVQDEETLNDMASICPVGAIEVKEDEPKEETPA